MPTDESSVWLSAALALPKEQSPFPWQRRLLEDFREGRVPTALDLPTGLGKTSVMAIWLVARALGAPLPRRLVYVVDRRAVVDQATTVAEGLRQVVQDDPAIRVALGLTGPLPISTLRGQHADNRSWLADPSAPAIVIGTVDMVGSRLLFSGYGVSRKMQPYHAGLLGADALFVLDEAHLVPPFERMLARVASGVDAQGRTLLADSTANGQKVPAVHLLSLSATGRHRNADTAFVLDDDDRAHPVVQQRLGAPKSIRIFEAVDAKLLPDALATHAWSLSGNGRRPSRIIVFTNSREHAQKVYLALQRLADKDTPVAVELFVGGRRVFERERAAARLVELGFLAGSKAVLDKPAYLVATSAGEVGVDIDADHAVCDLAPWERMVQRVGRVNRRGTGNATVAVVPAPVDNEDRQARLDATLALLLQLPLTKDAARNGSPAALGALKSSAEAAALLERASTPALLHPPLSRALVDAWAMTSLESHPGRPEVAPWLRGWPEEADPPQVDIVWRSLLPINDAGVAFSGSTLEMFMDAAGPQLVERLEAEVPQALDWLVKRAKRLLDGKSQDRHSGEGSPPLLRSDPIAVLTPLADGAVRVLTGDAVAEARRTELENWLRQATLWVDTRLGGLTDGLLDADSDRPGIDVTQTRNLDGSPVLPFSLKRIDSPNVPPPETNWRYEASFPLQQTDEGVTAWMVISSLTSEMAGSEEGRSGAQRAQLLSEHQAWAEAAARKLASALALDEIHAEMLAAAAVVHDEGKQAARWQQAFRAPGNGRPPYAKTLGRPDVALLDGYRHEFGSLPFAEAHPRIRALPIDLRELCLHLVAAHHGAARPLIRTTGAAEPPSRAAARAREVALRFAALSERWGPWGLAWWEALLRAADQQASRRNDEEGRHHG